MHIFEKNTRKLMDARVSNTGDVAIWKVWWDLLLDIIKESMSHLFLKGFNRKGKRIKYKRDIF